MNALPVAATLVPSRVPSFQNAGILSGSEDFADSYVSQYGSRTQMEKMINFMHLKPSMNNEVGAAVQAADEGDIDMLDLVEFDRAYPIA